MRFCVVSFQGVGLSFQSLHVVLFVIDVMYLLSHFDVFVGIRKNLIRIDVHIFGIFSSTHRNALHKHNIFLGL